MSMLWLGKVTWIFSAPNLFHMLNNQRGNGRFYIKLYDSHIIDMYVLILLLGYHLQ